MHNLKVRLLPLLLLLLILLLGGEVLGHTASLGEVSGDFCAPSEIYYVYTETDMH